MSTLKRPTRSADPLVWRDQLRADLESAAKQASSSMQAVMHKMIALIGNARPDGALDQQAFQDVQEAFARYMQESSEGVPPLLLECLEWIHVCFIAPNAAAGGAAAGKKPSTGTTGSREALRIPPAAAGQKSGKDGFDSGSAARARALSGEPSVESPEKKQQQDRETLKNWQLNSQLGKVRG